MNRRRSRAKAMVCALAIGVGPILISQSATADPNGTVVVPHPGASTVGDVVLPIAGSADWLVYAQSHQVVPNGAYDQPQDGEDGPYLPEDASTRAIMARSASGTLVTVSTTALHDRSWSIASGILTAIAPANTNDRHIDWWDLTAGTSGTLVLPKNSRYAGAAPDGVVYANAHHALIQRPISGDATTSYGKSAGKHLYQGVAGPDGMLIEGGKRDHYVTYGHPKSGVELAKPPYGDPLVCPSISSTDAACYQYDDGDDDATPLLDVLIPLNGSKVTWTKTCPNVPQISGKAMYWSTAHYLHTGHCHRTLGRLARLTSRHSPHVTSIKAATYGASAYGSAIFLTNGLDRLISATQGGDSATAYSAPSSPVTSGTFALSAGRLTETDDEADASNPDDIVSIRQHPVTGDASSISLGTPVVVPPAGGIPVDGAVLAASGTATAYEGASAGRTIALRINAPDLSTTIPNVQYGSQGVTLSGNRVLYHHESGQGIDSWRLRDLVTGETSKLGGQSDVFTLWGDYLLSQDQETSGPLMLTDLTTETSTIIRKHNISTFGQYGDQIFVYDYPHRHLDIYTVGTKDRTARIDLSRLAYQYPFDFTSDGLRYGDDSSYLLRTWSGDTVALLDYSDVLNGVTPQLSGHSEAWQAPDYSIHAAPIDVPLSAPWSLGDPLAPPTFALGGSHQWTTSIPYSMPLTSCTVTISKGATTERALPCDAAPAGQGVAAVTWDGEDTGGDAVPAGTYTWTVTAAGGGGPALDATGNATPVTGSISVTN